MQFQWPSVLLLGLLLAVGSVRAEAFELGLLAGTARLEQALTGTQASFEPAFGIAGREELSSRFAFFGDAVVTSTETVERGDAGLLVLRAGVEMDLQRRQPGGWTAVLGVGYTWIDFDRGAGYSNGLYSLGLGQRFVYDWGVLFWQARADMTVSRSTWYKTLNDGKLLAGCAWKIPIGR